MSSGAMKASPQVEGFHVSFNSGSLGPISKVPGILVNRNLFYTCRGITKVNCNSLYSFGILLDNPDPQLKAGLLMPGVGVFVR